MAKTRHSSLEMVDQEAIFKDTKKKDLFNKARNKLSNLGDVLKPTTKSVGEESPTTKKSRTQATLDYFFKSCPNKSDRNQIYSNNNNGTSHHQKIQKQLSVGAYPTTDLDDPFTDVEDNNVVGTISRLRPATICIDRLNGDTAALALERPRKKLSFKDPEICPSRNVFSATPSRTRYGSVPPRRKDAIIIESKRQNGYHKQNGHNGGLEVYQEFDYDESELESQAMRVVRTVGQAFEVCHKLAITAPDHENQHDDCDDDDDEEHETLTQDLVSDRLSDITSDKPKKEGANSDKMSLPDVSSYRDLTALDTHHLQQQHLLHRTSGPGPGHTVSSIGQSRYHHLELMLQPNTLAGGGGPQGASNTSSRISPITSVDINPDHHNNQQQNQVSSSSIPTTASAIGNSGAPLSIHHELQLLREQLDQQTQQTQAAMAQLQLTREQLAAEQSARMEAQTRTHQLLVHNRELLDHIAALVAHLQGGEKTASSQQQSPHVTMPQQQHPIHSDSYYSESTDPNHIDQQQYQALIENRAVTQSCLPQSPLRTTFNPSGNVFSFAYPTPQDLNFETQLLQRLQALSGYTPPYAYGYSQPLYQPLFQPSILNSAYSTLQHPPKKNTLPQQSPLPLRHSFGASSSNTLDTRLSPLRNTENIYQSQQNLLLYQPTNQSPNHLQVSSQPQTQNRLAQVSSLTDRKSEPKYIKPLTQMGTITTTDSLGRVRVIVPMPGNSDEPTTMMSTLRLSDEVKGAPITRSTSEKVPNRSELMSQVQRTTWARHTTK